MSYYGCVWMVIGALLLWTLFRRLHRDFQIRQNSLDTRVLELTSLLLPFVRYTTKGITAYLQKGDLRIEIETRGADCCNWEPIYYEGKWCIDLTPEVEEVVRQLFDDLESCIDSRNETFRNEQALRTKARTAKLLERMNS